MRIEEHIEICDALELKQYLDKNKINVNIQDANKMSVLSRMILHGDAQAVEVLLKLEDIDLNLQDKDGNTPLILAIKHRQIDLIPVLLSSEKVWAHLQSHIGENVLAVAFSKDSYQNAEEQHQVTYFNIEQQIKEGIQSKSKDVQKLIFNLACALGKTQIVDFLLKEKICNTNDVYIQSIFALLIQHNHCDLVLVLLANNPALVNVPNSKQATPFVIACAAGQTKLVKDLLSHPTIKSEIDINYVNNLGYTALFVACYRGHAEIVSTLLGEERIDVNKFLNNKNQTVLMLICGYIALIQDLDARIIPSQITREQVEQIMALIKQNYYAAIIKEVEKSNVLVRPAMPLLNQIIQLLVNHEKTDVDLKDTEGKSALVHACEYGHASFVQLLINKNANINSQDVELQTPFHRVISTKIDRPEKMQLLFSLPNLDISLQGRMKISIEGEPHLTILTNFLMFMILNFAFSMEEYDVSALWESSQVFVQVSQSGRFPSIDGAMARKFDMLFKWSGTTPIGSLGQCQTILDLLLYFNFTQIKHKQKLASAITFLFERLCFNWFKADQFAHFIRVLPLLQRDKSLQDCVALIQNKEEELLQYMAFVQKKDQFEIDLGMYITDFLYELLVYNQSYNAFQLQTVTRMVDQLWDSRCQQYYVAQLLIFFLFFVLNVVLGSLYVGNYHQQCNEAGSQLDAEHKVLTWLVFVIALFLLIGEILQSNYEFIKNTIMSSIKFEHKTVDTLLGRVLSYLRFTTTIINLFDLFIVVTGIILPFIWNCENDNLASFFSFYTIALFFRFLLWLSPNREYGYYILMMFTIIWNTKLYIVLLFMFLLIFTLAFLILSSNPQTDYSLLFEKQFFESMFGIFGNADLEIYLSLDSPNREVALFLLSVFVIIIPLLAINLLIALMTTTYEDLSRKQDAAFNGNKAAIALEAFYFYENFNRIFCRKNISSKRLKTFVIDQQGIKSQQINESRDYKIQYSFQVMHDLCRLILSKQAALQEVQNKLLQDLNSANKQGTSKEPIKAE